MRFKKKVVGLVTSLYLFGLLALVPAIASSLSDLVETMAPGTYAELPTNGLTDEMLVPTGQTNYITQFAENAVWHAATETVFFIGWPHQSTTRFISYNVPTNTWTQLPQPFETSGHANDHQTITATDMYYRKFELVHKYNIATQTWTVLPPIPSSFLTEQCCGILEYFPTMNSLVFIDPDWGIFLYDLDTNTWTHHANTSQQVLPGPLYPLATPGQGWNTVGTYSPVHDVLVFGGGGDGSRNVYQMDAAGTIQSMQPAPINWGINFTVMTADPVTGDMVLVTETRQTWVYHPDTDVWEQLAIPEAPFYDLGPDGTIFGTWVVPIDAHGVLMYLTYAWSEQSAVHLFKHANAGPPPPPDTDPPLPPTNSRLTSVDVAWDASLSGDVVQYLVQWGTMADGPYPNEVIVTSPGTQATIPVAGIASLFYIVIAEDGAGNQSPPTREIAVMW